MTKYQVANGEKQAKHNILGLISKGLNAPVVNTGPVRNFLFVSGELVISLLYCVWIKQCLNLILFITESFYSSLGLVYFIYIPFLNLETRVKPVYRTKPPPLQFSNYVFISFFFVHPHVIFHESKIDCPSICLFLTRWGFHRVSLYSMWN